MRDLKKYNSKYLQATQAIKNFETFKKDLQGGNDLENIPIVLIKGVKLTLKNYSSKDETILGLKFAMALADTLHCLSLDFEQPKDKFNVAICFRDMTKNCLYRKGASEAGPGNTATSRDAQEIFKTV